MPAMIDVLVVSHHTAAETLALLARLPRTHFTPHVLENGSGPNDLAALRAGGVEPVVSAVNLGFAGGVNRLARECTREWLLLVNPDLVPAGGLFSAVLELLSPCAPMSSNAGLLSPGSVAADVAVIGGFVAGAGPRSHGRFPGLLDRFRRGEAVVGGAAREVDWVSGCFMLVRRRVFAELGGFDEGYFMQLEDVDFCWRAKAAGWRVMVEPRFEFGHRGHLSYARGGRSLSRDYRDGKARFLQRSGRPVAAAALRAAHALLGLNRRLAS